MTKHDDGIDEILSDVDAFKKKCLAESRKKNPNMSEAQHEEAWKQMVEQFGLE